MTETRSGFRSILSNALDYLIVLFIILGSMSVFNQSTEREYHILPICAALVALHFTLNYQIFRFEHVKRLLPFVALWGAYLGVYAFVGGGEIGDLFKKFGIMFLLLVAYFYSHMLAGTTKRPLMCYVHIIFVISLISLFLWVTASVLHWFHSTGPMLIDWGKERKVWGFYNLYFHWQNDFFIHGHRFMRNVGIFTEAPMYSLHLCTALLIDNLFLKSQSTFRKFRMAVLALTVFTTFSVTGYLLVMVVVVVNIYGAIYRLVKSDSEAEQKKGKYLLVGVTVLGLVLAIVGFLLIKDKLASRSGGSRLEDYKIGFLAWRDHPWFGWGYGNNEARLTYASWRRLHRAESGFTNSPMAILCEGGVWFFTAFVLPIVYGFVTSFEQKNWREVFFLVLWVYLIVTTIFHHSILMVAFMAYYYADFLNKGYLPKGRQSL